MIRIWVGFVLGSEILFGLFQSFQLLIVFSLSGLRLEYFLFVLDCWKLLLFFLFPNIAATSTLITQSLFSRVLKVSSSPPAGSLSFNFNHVLDSLWLLICTVFLDSLYVFYILFLKKKEKNLPFWKFSYEMKSSKRLLLFFSICNNWSSLLLSHWVELQNFFLLCIFLSSSS